jgi:allantoate deiminase
MLTWDRLQALGEFSDERGKLTRVFGGKGMKDASARLAEWMRAARLIVTTDDWGNIFGRTFHPEYMPLLVIGSHFDTVPNGGKYDGALGILAGLAAIEQLTPSEIKNLPFAIEIAGFSDEEGSRFQTTYLGSRAAAGGIQKSDLERKDATGRTLASLVPANSHNPEPRYQKGHLVAYWEAHIEQGPVLESLNLPLAIVNGIAGQTRARLSFTGAAAHAGTCPMNLRKDALAGASEFVLAVEKISKEIPGLLGTVGVLDVAQPASNVVPGRTALTLDLRHLNNDTRRNALASLKKSAEDAAVSRNLQLDWEIVQENSAVASDPRQMAVLRWAVSQSQEKVPELCSGAGHDAVVMAKVAPMAMLFVRCRGGVSHHPEEYCSPEDVAACANALAEAIRELARSF